MWLSQANGSFNFLPVRVDQDRASLPTATEVVVGDAGKLPIRSFAGAPTWKSDLVWIRQLRSALVKARRLIDTNAGNERVGALELIQKRIHRVLGSFAVRGNLPRRCRTGV